MLKYKPFHHRTFGMFGKLDYSILTHMLMLSGILGGVGSLGSDGLVDEYIHASKYKPFHRFWHVRQAYSILNMLMLSRLGLAVLYDGRLGSDGLVDEPPSMLLKYKPFHHRTFGMFGKLDCSILTHMLMLWVG